MVILVVLPVLLLGIFALKNLQVRYQCLLPFIFHPDKLRVGLILANIYVGLLEVLVAARVLLRYVAGELLYLEIVEALVH